MEISSQSPVSNQGTSGQKRSGRSRVTNGSKLLLGIDGRSPWVRRCKDVLAAHLSDLGGADNTSAAERSIIRRAAVLTTELERLEVKFASAGEASTEDLDTYSRVSANLRRLLEAVGLQRRAKTVSSSFGDILRRDLEYRDPELGANQQRGLP
jgi:hypothetical protein